ncbi:proline iminopeptidase [Gelidibacter algens]|uniref:Proline iminopeptidase n=1 Tax=Gelidibacter algens TaxID=49280 RepID=A0A1A7QQ69_9FLAO|nr:alpha/beta hydrolase [Gelidibacter algens]OBX21359.1 alpha/beta hydrolase [Gelidibacter algens]RAJ25092.1 proline iminopeptidase [Gelidibacter algens]
MKSKKKLLIVTLSILVGIQFSCSDIDPNEPGALVPKTAEQDANIPAIDVNGTRLHAETFGDPNNSMVIFLHGGPGADYRNGINVKELANDGYYVVFYDQRGSGLSKRHDKNSYTIQMMIDDLGAVIEYYKTSPTQKVFLIGHSWGAMLSTAYVNQNPSNITGLILAEAGGLNYDDFTTYGESSKKLNLFSETTNNVLYIDQFFTGKENQHEILDYKLNIRSAFSFAPGNEEGIEGPSPFWRNGAMVLAGLADIAEKDKFDFTTNLGQYSTKVLLLYGENNKSYGLSFAQKEANYFPSSDIAKIENTGHEMFYFNWNSVHPKVLAYLNTLN